MRAEIPSPDSGKRKPGRVGISSLVSNIKILAILIPLIGVPTALYGFILSPKINEVSGLRDELAQKKVPRTVGKVEPSSEERESWREAQMVVSGKLFPYEPLNILRELAYLAHKVHVDKVMDISAPGESKVRASKKATAPLEHYSARISFYVERYDAFLDFLKMMNEFSSLVDVESVKLNGESRGILVNLSLRVYKTRDTRREEG